MLPYIYFQHQYVRQYLSQQINFNIQKYFWRIFIAIYCVNEKFVWGQVELWRKKKMNNIKKNGQNWNYIFLRRWRWSWWPMVIDHDDHDDHDHYDVCPGKTVQRLPWKSTLGSIRPGTFLLGWNQTRYNNAWLKSDKVQLCLVKIRQGTILLG